MPHVLWPITNASVARTHAGPDWKSLQKSRVRVGRSEEGDPKGEEWS